MIRSRMPAIQRFRLKSNRNHYERCCSRPRFGDSVYRFRFEYRYTFLRQCLVRRKPDFESSSRTSSRKALSSVLPRVPRDADPPRLGSRPQKGHHESVEVSSRHPASGRGYLSKDIIPNPFPPIRCGSVAKQAYNPCHSRLDEMAAQYREPDILVPLPSRIFPGR